MTPFPPVLAHPLGQTLVLCFAAFLWVQSPGTWESRLRHIAQLPSLLKLCLSCLYTLPGDQSYQSQGFQPWLHTCKTAEEEQCSCCSCHNQGSDPQSAPKTSLWSCEAGERSCGKRVCFLVIIFKAGGEEERGKRAPLGLRSKLCSWKEMLLKQRRKDFTLQGLKSSLGRLAWIWKLHLSMSPCHLQKGCGRELSCQKRIGKWFGLHSLIQKPFLTSVSILHSKISSVFL